MPGLTRQELFFSAQDPRGERQFLFWHHTRHKTYDLLNAKNNGISLHTLDLTGPVDSDWKYRHAGRHSVLRQIIANAGGSWINANGQTGPWINANGQLDGWISSGAFRAANVFNTYELVNVNWKDEVSLNDWQRRHALDHADLDQFFGVT